MGRTLIIGVCCTGEVNRGISDETDGRTVLAGTISFAEEPTPASKWHALAGSALTDELLEWPADLSALTNVILKRTEA
jgi:hypothetical protein